MPFVLEIAFGALFAAILAGLTWRISSRHTSLPCPSFLATLVEMDNPFAKDQNANAIVQRLGLRPGMRVLDAGCGPGRVTIPLAQAIEAGGEVVAMDIQPGMLRRAQDKARAAGLFNIRFREAALGAGSLGVAEFDRILLVTVLGEIPNRQSALLEAARALKPGGILSITELVFDPHYQRRQTILALAGNAGLRQKDYWGNPMAFTLHFEKQEHA